MSEADELRAALAAADKLIERLTDQREEMAQRIDALTTRLAELEAIIAKMPPDRLMQDILGWMRDG